MADSTRKFGVIGYALEPKKIQSFIQNSLLNLTKERGIDLVRIDSEKPLIDQGPFDCILHKRDGEEWKKELKEYSFKNPEVVIIDPPDAIERLHKRDTMLQVVKELRIPQENESFGIPKQIVIDESGESLDPSALEDLTFPVIAKPLVANGSAKSHKMFLVFNQDGLNTLKPPIVLQEFVNHGGVIFKVYVVGEFVKCVPRKSLPDISEEKLGCSEGLMSFSHISNLTSQERSDDNYYEMMNLVKPGLPPLNFVADIARGLREAMGLRLFNFDVIRDSRVGNRYFIIDINYFPGYAKMPSYETVLTDFFGNILHQKRQGALGLDKKENTETESDCRKFRSCEKEDIRLVSNSGCTDEVDGQA